MPNCGSSEAWSSRWEGWSRSRLLTSLDGLASRDSDLAQRAIAVDPDVDTLQHEIEEKAILTIARRQPMAIDLREIIGALRIANDLERIGDLAKNIGKRVLPLSDDLHRAT